MGGLAFPCRAALRKRWLDPLGKAALACALAGPERPNAKRGKQVKFFIINTFRTVLYISYFATIAYGIWTGVHNGGNFSQSFFGTFGMNFGQGMSQFLDIVMLGGIGFLIANVVGGLLLTILDIRDDINDRLPDARRDD